MSDEAMKILIVMALGFAVGWGARAIFVTYMEWRERRQFVAGADYGRECVKKGIEPTMSRVMSSASHMHGFIKGAVFACAETGKDVTETMTRFGFNEHGPTVVDENRHK